MFQVAIRVLGPWRTLRRWLGLAVPEGVLRVDGRMFYIAEGDRERRIPRSRLANAALRRSRARSSAPSRVEVVIDLTTGETIRLDVGSRADGAALLHALAAKR